MTDSLTLEDIHLGPPLAARACGDCAACCVLPEIDAPELAKPAGAICPHCTGSACGNYAARPAPCRSFHCAWRRMGALPDEARPDRLGVMFHFVRTPEPPNALARVFIRGQALESKDNFAHPLLPEIVETLAATGLPVWLDHGGRMWIVHPMGPAAEILVEGAAPRSLEDAAEARAWLDRLAAIG